MINFKRITRIDDNLFTSLLPIYLEAFPPQERRNIEQLKNFIETKPGMHFNAIQEAGELCGLITYWDFNSFRYLEYLAVSPQKRNHKIGQKALDYMKLKMPGPFLLEVEPISDEMTERRINFYQRNGYEVLEKNYTQPSYNERPEDCIPLWIMGNTELITSNQLPEFIKTIKKEVYGTKEIE